jgi:hypothetical protein
MVRNPYYPEYKKPPPEYKVGDVVMCVKHLSSPLLGKVRDIFVSDIAGFSHEYFMDPLEGFEKEQLFEGGGCREPDVVPIDNTTVQRMVSLKKDIVSKEDISNKMCNDCCENVKRPIQKEIDRKSKILNELQYRTMAKIPEWKNRMYYFER